MHYGATLHLSIFKKRMTSSAASTTKRKLQKSSESCKAAVTMLQPVLSWAAEPLTCSQSAHRATACAGHCLIASVNT